MSKVAASVTEDTIKALAENIQVSIKEGAEEFTIAKEVYEKALPEGLTLDVVKQVASHNANYIAAATQVASAAAYLALEENKDVQKVSGTIKTPLIEAKATIHRSKGFSNPQNHTRFEVPGKIILGFNMRHEGLDTVIDAQEALAKKLFG